LEKKLKYTFGAYFSNMIDGKESV